MKRLERPRPVLEQFFRESRCETANPAVAQLHAQDPHGVQNAAEILEILNAWLDLSLQDKTTIIAMVRALTRSPRATPQDGKENPKSGSDGKQPCFTGPRLFHQQPLPIRLSPISCYEAVNRTSAVSVMPASHVGRTETFSLLDHVTERREGLLIELSSFVSLHEDLLNFGIVGFGNLGGDADRNSLVQRRVEQPFLVALD